MNSPSIVDSHVHLWHPAQLRYAWLDGLPALNRPFLPPDFAAAAATANVSKMIFVESGCVAAQSHAEVAWVAGLKKVEPRLKGIIAYAPLEDGTAVRAELQALAAEPLVKGVRRLLQSENDADFCLQPQFLAGVKLLAEFGFTFDLCIRSNQLRSVTELVQCVPQVTFILDHCGKPGIARGEIQPWAADLRMLAAQPNVVCKLSGLTTEADHARWQPDDLKFYVERALEYFGFDRVLFGGDWPVSTLATTYGRWVETVQQFVASATEAERAKLFQTNAERIYHV